MSIVAFRRRVPIGAEPYPPAGVHYRVWAPNATHVRVALDDTRVVPLEAEGAGYFAGVDPAGCAGDRYRYQLDDDPPLADPASRWQPDGPDGPSVVVDPATFRWNDASWGGVSLPGQVVYELHAGTFTPEGTWAAAAERLDDLRELGVTVVELMPVAEFGGRFGWGYDGVFPYAPTRLYGTPDDLRRFVDHAHRVGLAVILDVVYNHLGPEGCVFAKYANAYFTRAYENEWGDALNFDGADSGPVREYFVANAGYWIGEYHLDGLRLDATQSIHDRSADHVIAAIARRVREAGGRRRTLIIAENEPQLVRMVRPVEEGGYGVDALWNDDFHHSAIVALTGRNEAYFSDHRGTPQELISAIKRGYLFQGQRYAWQRKPRGTRADGVPPASFVTYLENHDQVANSGYGLRLHARTSPGRMRAMTALLLLGPGTPMLFQGQEMASCAPFVYFADHQGELARAVRRGRAEFVSQFPSLASPEAQATLDDPSAASTFERCRLDWYDRERHAQTYRLHVDLLRLRREDPAIAAQGTHGVDGAILDREVFVLRLNGPGGPLDERLLVINLGRDLVAPSFAEPLVAPPDGTQWRVGWSSEAPKYGGDGTPPVVSDDGWRIPGHAAVLLAPVVVGAPDRALEEQDA